MANSGSTPPEYPTPKQTSYANVTASSSHQSNLPFDPKRIVPIGTYNEKDGKKVLGFSSSENDRLAASWKLTLIGKFSFAIPHPKGIDSGFSALNLKGPFSWSFANPSHIIIKLQLEEDFNKLWMGTLWSLGDCPMRVFKWTPSFNPKTEAPLALIGFVFGNIIGTPLQVDSQTASRSRLSMARVCVELNLLKERIDELVLEFDDTSQVQKIIYERIPDYCTHCKHIGHSVEGCYMNGNVTRPPPPVRRPSTIESSDGFVSKGLSGNMDKSRGAKGILKTSGTENPNSSRGANRVVPQNQEWIKVNKKGPRETGLVSKELQKLAKHSKHTYFEDSLSHAEGSGNNRFLSLANSDDQTPDTLPQLINGSDQGFASHVDDRTDSSIVANKPVGDVAFL
ncbi:hypothetical protein DH2020_050039 [Rehmannia glutinosa]|uniref:DUF4283 domain-containing protein n=1 Tax=Rehmannia glutinosa TaxID=99300 RepID=A0ABR0U158_REHGL